MEEKIKNILSAYIKVAAADINSETIIDRSAVDSSIILHRMYAQLAKEKIIVTDYWDIKTFGTLLSKVTGNTGVPLVTMPSVFQQAGASIEPSASVGIDIEEIQLLPQAVDFREDTFYVMNFAPVEIAYCILQPNPVASFAGLFAVKEAIVKTDAAYAGRLFNTIIIDHLGNGKPVHPSFQLSISHTATVAIGIAIKAAPIFSPTTFLPPVDNVKKSSSFYYLLCFIAIGLSLLAILVALFGRA